MAHQVDHTLQQAHGRQITMIRITPETAQHGQRLQLATLQERALEQKNMAYIRLKMLLVIEKMS